MSETDQDSAARAAERIYDEWGAVGLGLAAVPSPSTISAIIREAYAPLLAELRAENRKWKRIRTPTHGSCCTCQACGLNYDECRCDLDDLADENARLRAENARSVVTNAKMAQVIADLDSEIERLRHIINPGEAAAHAEYQAHIEQEIERLREALRFYADKESYEIACSDAGHAPIEIDAGQTARAALAATEEKP